VNEGWEINDDTVLTGLRNDIMRVVEARTNYRYDPEMAARAANAAVKAIKKWRDE
jgi:hypothetical protein